MNRETRKFLASKMRELYAAEHALFEADARAPAAAQERVLREIEVELRNGTFWKAALTEAPLQLDAFPITEFSDYKKAIEDSIQSAVSPFTGRPVDFWALSSGTTGVPKVFPVTEAFRNQFQRPLGPQIHGFFQAFPRFLEEPILYFAAADAKHDYPADMSVGYISTFNYRNMPEALRSLYAFPPELLSDADTFARWSPVYALLQDLSALIAVTPTQLVQLFESIEKNRAEWIEMLEGSRPPPPGLPAPVASPERLALVKAALSRERVDACELWPSLQFIVSWKSATCGLQLAALAPYIPGIPVLDAVYSATEGWVNVPQPDGSAGGPVHPGTHFYEFSEAGAEPSPASLVPLSSLEVGKEYEVFLTTSLGFIRYRLYDVVRCTGMYASTPIVEFSHKSGRCLSLGSVKLEEPVLAAALTHAGCEGLRNAVFAPNPSGDGLSLLMPEHAPALSDEKLKRIESALIDLHEDYRLEIGGSIRALELRLLPDDHPLWARKHGQAKPTLLLPRLP